MPEEKDDDLTEAQKQLYRKKRVPHKFCPYCGTKNEPEADRCSSCAKDISWMKVPEALPDEYKPPQKPKSLPTQKQPVFTWRAILVFVLIVLVVAALIVVIYFTTARGAEQAMVIGWRFGEPNAASSLLALTAPRASVPRVLVL